MTAWEVNYTNYIYGDFGGFEIRYSIFYFCIEVCQNHVVNVMVGHIEMQQKNA